VLLFLLLFLLKPQQLLQKSLAEAAAGKARKRLLVPHTLTGAGTLVHI
jgi:hypothetical protein